MLAGTDNYHDAFVLFRDARVAAYMLQAEKKKVLSDKMENLRDMNAIASVTSQRSIRLKVNQHDDSQPS